MQSIFDMLCGFILVLLGFLVTAIAIVEGMARSVLSAIGIHGTPQTVLLFVLLIALVALSFRFFGRLFAVLLAAALCVYVAQAVAGHFGGSFLPIQASAGTTDI